MNLLNVVATVLNSPVPVAATAVPVLAKNGAFSYHTIERMVYDKLNRSEKVQEGEFKIRKYSAEKKILECEKKINEEPKPIRDYVKIGKTTATYAFEFNEKPEFKSIYKDINKLTKLEKERTNDALKATYEYHRLRRMSKKSQAIMNYMYYRLWTFILVSNGVQNLKIEPDFEFSYDDKVFMNTIASNISIGLNKFMFQNVEIGKLEDYLIELEEDKWTKTNVITRDIFNYFKKFITDAIEIKPSPEGIPVINFVDIENLPRDFYTRSFSGLMMNFLISNGKISPDWNKKKKETTEPVRFVSDDVRRVHECKVAVPVEETEPEEFDYNKYKLPENTKMILPEKEMKIILASLDYLFKDQGYEFEVFYNPQVHQNIILITTKDGKSTGHAIDCGGTFGGEKLIVTSHDMNGDLIPVDAIKHPNIVKKIIENDYYTLTADEAFTAMEDFKNFHVGVWKDQPINVQLLQQNNIAAQQNAQVQQQNTSTNTQQSNSFNNGTVVSGGGITPDFRDKLAQQQNASIDYQQLYAQFAQDQNYQLFGNNWSNSIFQWGNVNIDPEINNSQDSQSQIPVNLEGIKEYSMFCTMLNSDKLSNVDKSRMIKMYPDFYNRYVEENKNV